MTRDTVFQSLARGFALFLGGFGLLNVIGNFWHPGFDANLWWLDLRRLSPSLASGIIAAVSSVLLIFGLRPPRSTWARSAVSISVAGVLAIALGNAVNFYTLAARGQINSRLPVSFSLLIASALALILARIWTRSQYRPRFIFAKDSRQVVESLPKGLPLPEGEGRGEGERRALSSDPVALRRCAPQTVGLVLSLAVCAACAVLFPLAQMFCFGKTDYRRSADVTVVLGARVYKDGRPSDALADRVRTACALYNAGLTQKLLFSGGPGDGSIHETESMKAMAIRLGVKPEDILLDKAGVNTEATAKNTKAVLQQLGASRVLVVSHFYHLPRVKLAYQREGLEVYTVPAKESYLLRQMPYNMAREVAALWVYYLRPLQA
jgi:uncharacterized SAM-binding protein YcdF (DUF218 family)